MTVLPTSKEEKSIKYAVETGKQPEGHVNDYYKVTSK